VPVVFCWEKLDCICNQIQCSFFTSGVVAARDGALTFMVGAEKDDYDQVEVILQNMAKNVVHCGAVGTGQVT